MRRCFRYAGCIGSFWHATNGLLQGDPLSVVILNCVLCPLFHQLSSIQGLSVYSFADDLTVVSSSWNVLYQAYQLLNLFCSSTDLILNTSKCQLWNKGSPLGDYPPAFDQFSFRVYPFLLGSPIDIGVSCAESLRQHDDITLSRAQKIAKLPLPYRVTYRLFVALVSSCYNHFALSCDITPTQNKSLKHAVTSILVPKRSTWVCREALYSLTTPGRLLSPQLFLNYRHIIEYLLYVRHASHSCRDKLTFYSLDQYPSYQMGSLLSIAECRQKLCGYLEDPAYSVDEPLDYLKHLIRDSYRQHLLSQAALRRHDCQGKTNLVDVALTRSHYLSQTQPLNQTLLRQILAGSVDHTSRLFKSNLTDTPFVLFVI